MHKKLIFLLKKNPIFLLLALISAEIGAIFLVLQYRTVANFTNLIIFDGFHPKTLLWLIVLITITILVRAVFQFFTEYFSKKQAVLINSELRKLLAEKMTRVGIETGKNSGYYQTLFIDGVDALENYFALFIPQVFFAFFIPVTIFLFVIPLDRLTVVIFLITAPLIPLFMMLIGRFSKKHTEKQYRTLSLMNAFFLDSIRGIKTLLVFNQEKSHLKRIKKVSEQYHKVTLSVLKVAFLSAFVLEFMSTLSTAVLAVEIGLRLLYGNLNFQTAFFILLIAPEFYLPIRNLGLRFHSSMDGVEAAKKIFSFLDLPEPKQNAILMHKLGDFEKLNRIRFDQVSARYPNQNHLVLNNVSFDLPFNQSSAIIGPSGSGKSTIFQIILRFMDPISGQVNLDQLTLGDINIDFWRNLIGWIPQKPYLYNGTLLENIRITKPMASEKEINQALKRANLDEFINSLPLKLETKISDLGTNLSSGQRQRIAIARVLLKDAKILLFDELTASLDAISEEKILTSIKEQRGSRTLISIAHRLNTIKDVDQIIFLNQGKISAKGNHSDLLLENPGYQEYLNCYFGVGV